MKKLLLGTLDLAAAAASLLASYALYRAAARFLKGVYSRMLGRSFAGFGEGGFIEFPAVIGGAEHIRIGRNFHASARLRLEACAAFNGETFSPGVTIGDNVDFNFDCHVGCLNRVVIGNDVLLASKVLIMDHSHGGLTRAELERPPIKRGLVSKGPIIIGDRVWIGEGATILGGVTIGEGSVIGANAVVTRDVPPYSVAAGNPARVIKTLK